MDFALGYKKENQSLESIPKDLLLTIIVWHLQGEVLSLQTLRGTDGQNTWSANSSQ